MPTEEPDKLLEFVTNLTGDQVLKIEEDLGSGYYKLNITEAERRQARHDIRSIEDVVVELVRNSRDAGASKVYIASARDADGTRTITIIDDGRGIPRQFHGSIFEPRVTTKVEEIIEDRFGIHGRGMALYSIRASTERLELLESEVGRGAVFTMSVPTKRLRERKDQSTFPKLKLSPAHKICVQSGPHNVWRHLVEISLDTPGIEIFFGSHGEILAALLADQRVTVADAPPIWSDLWRLDDPEALSDRGAALGLKASPRSCRRVLEGEIEPPHSIQCRLRRLLAERPVVKVSRRREPSKVSADDLDELAKVVADNFRVLGDKYFLRVKGEPRVSCSSTKISIELQIESDESW